MTGADEVLGAALAAGGGDAPPRQAVSARLVARRVANARKVSFIAHPASCLEG
jgi:hypothetical protein